MKAARFRRQCLEQTKSYKPGTKIFLRYIKESALHHQMPGTGTLGVSMLMSSLAQGH